MEGIDKKDGAKKHERGDKKFREEIFSKAVRAGKRTYFFDVKSTRKNEYFLTITESKKKFEQDGKYHFEKHKVFLYKEDFDKFMEGLNEIIDYIQERQPYEPGEFEERDVLKEYSDVEFEDLASS